MIEEEDDESDLTNTSSNDDVKITQHSLELENDDDLVMDDSELKSINGCDKIKKTKQESVENDENELTKIILHPSLQSLRFTRLEWVKLAGKKEVLAKIGLAALPTCEISMDAENGLNPNLFSG